MTAILVAVSLLVDAYAYVAANTIYDATLSAEQIVSADWSILLKTTGGHSVVDISQRM